MAQTTLSRDQVIQVFLDHIRANITGADISVGSDYYLKAIQLADVFRGNQGQAIYLAKQIFPITSSDPELTKHATARGLSRQPAVGSVGRVIVRGPDNGDDFGLLRQEAGTTLTHSDGTIYEFVYDVSFNWSVWAYSDFYEGSIYSKTVGKNATTSRIPIKLGTDAAMTDMQVGEVIKVNGEYSVIKDILSTIIAIEIEPPLLNAPNEDDAITCVPGSAAEIICQSTGASTNKSERDTLTIDTVGHASVNASAIVIDLTGGGDLETADELKARIQSHDSQGNDGTPEYFRTLCRETEGIRIADAIVFANFRGLGAHDIILIGVAGARMVGDTAIAIVQDYINKKTSDDIVVKTFEYDEGDPIIIEVYPESGYEKDWEGTTLSYAVDEQYSDANSIAVIGDATGSINAGNRIVIDHYTPTDRYVEIREAVSLQYNLALGYTEITMNEDLDDGFTVGYNSVVYAGGPLTEIVMDAIVDFIDALGPSSIDVSGNVYERQPEPGTEWPHYLRLSALEAACHAVDGVESVTITSPLSDQLPTIQQILNPSYVLIKYAE